MHCVSMKILQLDVDSITYELMKPEAKFYEESTRKSVTIEDTLVLMVSVEREDDGSVAEKAAADAIVVAASWRERKFSFTHSPT